MGVWCTRRSVLYTVIDGTASICMSETTLFLIHRGLTPMLQPCAGPVKELFESNMSKLYDDRMASPGLERDNRRYPEAPLGGSLSQRIKQAWGWWMPRVSVRAGRKLACYFLFTNLETRFGPKGVQLRRLVEALGRIRRCASWWCGVAAKTCNRCYSSAFITPPTLWNMATIFVCNRYHPPLLSRPYSIPPGGVE